jgi:hypothetical protein
MSRTHLCALIVTTLVACQRIPQEVFPGVGPSRGGDSPTPPPAVTPPAAVDGGGLPPGTVITDPPASPTCIEGIEGSETSCKSQAEWKELVHAICQARGEELTFYSIGGGDCGDGRTRYAKYQCCPPHPVLPPPPPPPPATPPPAPACFGASQGSDGSCKSPEVWRRYASDDCQARGASLTGIDFAVECGGGNYRFTKYVCCPADPCAGKSCGEACQGCTPGDTGCGASDSRRCNFVGKCVAEPETTMCSSGASSCPPGLTWCFFSGRCVDPHCRTCCDSNATPCQTAADCGPSCTTCADGSQSCQAATCGERDPGSCFFFEPKCPGK